MPKIKTHSGAKKRFKVSKTGKILRAKAYKSHILNKKTTSAREIRKPVWLTLQTRRRSGA